MGNRCWIDEALERQGLLFDAKGRARRIDAPLAPVADTHAHLSMLGPDSDGAKVPSRASLEAAAVALARAWLVGVTWVVSIADASEDARDPAAYLDWLSAVEERAHEEIEAALAAGIVPAFPDEPLRVSLSAGVHPYGAADVDDEALGRLRLIASDRRCVALGEMGLDYHCDVDRELQRAAFERQLALAVELGLPVELHVRDATGDAELVAHRDAFEVVEASGIRDRGIDLHCYTLGPDAMAPWVGLGAKVAFGGALTFKRSDEIREAAGRCPSEAPITETDSPYMAPEPFRGRPSEPALALATAWRVVEARAGTDASSEATFRALWKNARALF